MPSDGIDRAFALAQLLMANKRISVRRIMSELEIPRSTAYRLLDQASRRLPSGWSVAWCTTPKAVI